MSYSNSLRSLAIGFAFLSIVYAVIAQPTFVIQNNMGSCEWLTNDSFELLVTSVNGNVSIFYFAPGIHGPITATVGVPVEISSLPPLLVLVVVQDDNGSSPLPVNIISYPDPLSISIGTV